MKRTIIITIGIILLPAAFVHSTLHLLFNTVMSFLFFPFKVLSSIAVSMIESERAKQVE